MPGRHGPHCLGKPSMDVLTPEQRSYCMSRIRGRDTKPELVVRRIVHAMGYRFRLHRRDLPGRPDIVLPRHRKVIEVRGCWWHGHSCRYGRPKARTNAEFWQEKLTGNVERDKRNVKALRRSGWRVLVVWECQTRDAERLLSRLERFLSG